VEAGSAADLPAVSHPAVVHRDVVPSAEVRRDVARPVVAHREADAGAAAEAECEKRILVHRRARGERGDKIFCLFTEQCFVDMIQVEWLSIHRLQPAERCKDPIAIADSTRNPERPGKTLTAVKLY